MSEGGCSFFFSKGSSWRVIEFRPFPPPSLWCMVDLMLRCFCCHRTREPVVHRMALCRCLRGSFLGFGEWRNEMNGLAEATQEGGARLYSQFLRLQRMWTVGIKRRPKSWDIFTLHCGTTYSPALAWWVGNAIDSKATGWCERRSRA